jgi:hypothetical protein
MLDNVNYDDIETILERLREQERDLSEDGDQEFIAEVVEE